MISPRSYSRRHGAVASAAVKALPNLPLIVGLYFMSMGLLALALALHRT
jgi:hypothetical protein